ncbi:hypothetical protein HK405_013889, partial [Cladochytrium tenue]
GWLFVQEYYTFLNKEPHKLHCFYDAKSSFIHATEGEPYLEPEHGQKEIHARITDLDFQDCKVLVSNVDSQASHDGCVVIMVLGEMSNKGGPSHKFCQCFVLAEQPAGYFVYNDIFRFLKEDVEDFDAQPETVEDDDPVEDEETEQPETAEDVETASPEPPSEIEPAAVASVSSAVEQDQTPKSAPSSPPKAPVTDVAPIAAEQPPTVVETPAPEPEPTTVAAPEPVKVEPKQRAPPPPAPVQAAPAEPPKPKTWANLAASNTQGWGDKASPAKGQVASVQASEPPTRSAAAAKSENYVNRPAQRPPPKKVQEPAERTASPSSQPDDSHSGFREVQNRRGGYERRNNRPPQGAPGP